jgi:hypothetical protein
MNPTLHQQIGQSRLDDWYREAEQDRLARAASQSRREQRQARPAPRPVAHRLRRALRLADR